MVNVSNEIKILKLRYEIKVLLMKMLKCEYELKKIEEEEGELKDNQYV